MDEAKAVIDGCRTDKGFKASTQLYPELWVRDLFYSEEALLKLGYGETVKKHLEAFYRRQRKNGNLPTVITSLWRRALNQTFHFWTCDTEILFITGVLDYADYSGDRGFIESHREQIERCVSYVEGRVNKLGLIPGTDWRDAVIGLDGRFLLSNQVQLVNMYDKLGRKEKSDALKEAIRETFLLPDEGYFADSVSWQGGNLLRDAHFDCLGSAVGILNGTVSGDGASAVCEQFRRADSGYGYRNVSPPYQIKRSEAFSSLGAMNAFVRNGAVLRNRSGSYQNSAVWPFVEARVISALRKSGQTLDAEKASVRMLRRRGLNEWYGPATGTPEGSNGQLWTAAAMIAQTW